MCWTESTSTHHEGGYRMVHPVEVLNCPNMVITKKNPQHLWNIWLQNDIKLTLESFAAGPVTTFKSESQHYEPPASHPGAVPAPSVFQTVPGPATSSVALQPLAGAVNASATSQTLQRPVAGCLSTQQVPGSSSGIAQPVSRPVTIPVTTQPVSMNITVPVVAQPVSRPETPATAQPVILNQVNLHPFKM